MSIQTIGTSGDFSTIAGYTADVKTIGTLTENEQGQPIDNKNYVRGAATDFDMSSLTLAGFTVLIKPAPGVRHDGTSGSGARVRADLGNADVYNVLDCIIEDFEIANTGTGSFNRVAVDIGNGGVVRRTLLEVESQSHSGNSVARIGFGGTLQVCYIKDGYTGIFIIDTRCTIENNGCTGLVVGVNSTSSNTITSMKNNYAYNCTDDWTGTFNGSPTNNASEDGTHPGTSGVTISGDPFESDGFTPSISGQLDAAGVDLSITLDVANLPYASTPAIGPFATLVAAGGGVTNYYYQRMMAA